MADFHFQCPHCSQELECAAECAGTEAQCPLCDHALLVPTPTGSPSPPAGMSVEDQVKHWIVEARILLLRAPPGYVRMLMEVPKGWTLPQNGMLPDLAFDAVTKTIRAKFPQCPITPVKVRVADPEALKRISEHTDYCNESCKAWFLGKATSLA